MKRLPMRNRFVLGFAVGCLAAVSGVAAEVDVAPFGRALAGDGSVGVEWPEMRRIVRLEFALKAGAAAPRPDEIKVEYWRHVWDGSALRRYGDVGAGSTGWAAADDWFNGEWKRAAAEVRFENHGAAVTFASSEKEFPDLKSRGVPYRPALKIRVAFPGAESKIASLRAYTDSTWRTADLNIRFEGRDTCDDALEAYNGRVVTKTAAADPAGDCALRASVEYALNPDDREADRTIVTVRSPENPFSFAVDEAERGDRIFVKDFGALVTRAVDPISIAEYRRVLDESGARTIYDRVSEEPEQTLPRAWKDMPLKQPYYFVLGCEGGRQRFRLDPDGALWMHWPSQPIRKDHSSPRWRWPDNVTYRFGLPQGHFSERTLADRYLPMVTTRWTYGDLVYEQEAFASLLAANLNSAPPIQADEPAVAFVKIRIANTAATVRRARLEFTSESQPEGKSDPVRQPLRLDGDLVLGSYDGGEFACYQVDARGSGSLSNAGGAVIYQIDLPPHQEHTLWVKAPFVTPSGEELARLRALQPERERDEVARYWRRRVAAGSEIVTPEPWLNEFYKAELTHLLINDERELGSDRYSARVGSFHYGAYGNESIMMISDLDRRGYAKEAERSLELFLHYQGSVALPGTFSSQKGELYGAGGYEAGGYNQHHGWILWGLAEHYWHTRDRAWMERASPKLVEACRWIASERKRTQVSGADGRRVPEYGLLPAGSLEDITDYWFWISTNSFTWWGLSDAAEALADFGHPEAAALVKEAAAYREDILAAYRGAMVRSPVVRLRDGTYVPTIPSNVYTRGRSYGWLRETLEGSIMLPITRLLDPGSREALWIMKDYEDNRYVSDRFGYSIPVFDQFWFSRGGFSMQPNLLHGPLPYFYRDEIKHFLRAYFNPFAAGYDPGLRMLPEHPLPELGYLAGDHFKTSDESQSTYWLRLMFASEIDGTLHLGRGLPRYWLRDGESVAIRNASTYFGKLSYEIRSQAGAGKIAMTLEAPVRNAPRQIVVRFRHPDARPMRAVTVNGAEWRDFDAKAGDIRLPGTMPGKTEIVAVY
ncbi:MAG TPA: hypothetical protein VF767_05060 [Bryobacteraceae bacterium]